MFFKSYCLSGHQVDIFFFVLVCFHKEQISSDFSTRALDLDHA